MDKLGTTRKQKSKAAETRMLAASMTTKWFFGLRKEWPHKKIHFFFVLWCKLIASGQIIMTQDWNCPHNVKTFCSKSLANLRVLYIYVLLWYSSEGIYTPLFFPVSWSTGIDIQFKEPNSEQGTIYNQIWQVIYSRVPEWVT